MEIPDELRTLAERAYRDASVRAVVDQIMDGDDGSGPAPEEVTGLAAFWSDIAVVEMDDDDRIRAWHVVGLIVLIAGVIALNVVYYRWIRS